MDLIFINDEKTPRVMYKPYIFATVKEYSTFCTVEKGNDVKVIMKDKKKSRKRSKYG